MRHYLLRALSNIVEMVNGSVSVSVHVFVHFVYSRLITITKRNPHIFHTFRFDCFTNMTAAHDFIQDLTFSSKLLILSLF